MFKLANMRQQNQIRTNLHSTPSNGLSLLPYIGHQEKSIFAVLFEGGPSLTWRLDTVNVITLLYNCIQQANFTGNFLRRLGKFKKDVGA